ncbi:MAG: hypothetical protein U0Q15_07490 [Kineosporiaceae bacterium]
MTSDTPSPTAPLDPDVVGLVPRGRGSALALGVVGVLACVVAWIGPHWRPALVGSGYGGMSAPLGDGHMLTALQLEPTGTGPVSIQAVSHEGPERIDGVWVVRTTAADWAPGGFLAGEPGSWTRPAPVSAEGLPTDVPDVDGRAGVHLVIRWSGVDCDRPSAHTAPRVRLRWLGAVPIEEDLPDLLAPGAACSS